MTDDEIAKLKIADAIGGGAALGIAMLLMWLL